jgi:hypothetical protein
MVPIVQFFYYAQFDAIDAAAVPAAVERISQWLAAFATRNFVVEVFNEKCGDKPVTPLGLTIAEMIEMVHNASTGRKLLVSASCGGGGLPAPAVVAAADYVLVHGNGQQPGGITSMIEKIKAMPAFAADPKPIVFNEDDHGHLAAGSGDSNLAAAVESGASWGFLCCCDSTVQGDYSTGFQCPPVNWAEGKCLSGGKGAPMPDGSKADFAAALRHYSSTEL